MTGTLITDERAELRNLPPEQAVEAWLQSCRRGGRPARLAMVRVPLTEALGRVLAEPIWAARSSPAFPAAAMDGIAVRATDTADAAPGRPVRLPAGTFDVVDTGNPLDSGRDAVVMREQVRFDDGVAEVEAGHHVRQIGEDIVVGELLLAPGHRLRPVDLSAAAAAGVTEIVVRRRAIVAILPTGDEPRPADATLAPGELADTNSLMLDGQVREAGCDTRRWPILPDDPDRLAAALVAAAAEADLVLLVAGTSAGRHDHAPDVLRRCGRIVVGGVAIRPGHPAVLGVVEHTPVMACPGYPVSAAIAFDELATPLIASLEGAAVGRRPTTVARLATDLHSKRGTHHLARVRLGTVDGVRTAMPLRGGASVLTSLVHADALLEIPAELESLCTTAAVQPGLLRSPTDLDGVLLLAGAPDLALDLLALAVADTGRRPGAVRVAFCEMAPAEGIALVRDGRCHAAAVAGGTRTQSIERTNGSLVTARLAECEVALAFAGDRHRRAAPTELLRSGIRLVAGPHGTPARRVFEDAARETGVCVRDIAEVRSDAAALATVAGGYADVAVSALPVARRVGLTTTTLGRAALDLVINRGVAERDQLLRALLDTMSSRSLAAALKGAGYDPVGVVRLSVNRSTALKSRVVKELRRKQAHSSLEATR